jgi:hypothetical protein
MKIIFGLTIILRQSKQSLNIKIIEKKLILDHFIDLEVRDCPSDYPVENPILTIRK